MSIGANLHHGPRRRAAVILLATAPPVRIRHPALGGVSASHQRLEHTHEHEFD